VVRVIDDEGTQLGELKTSEGIEIASRKGLDLVEVAPKAEPPVCRMMDYGKYKYHKSKKEQRAKKRQRVVKLKEIKTTPRTSEHDYQFKLKHILRFLKDGSKVKVTVFFRGRQITHPELGIDMLNRFIADTQEMAQVTQEAKKEGRTMNIILESKIKLPVQKEQEPEKQKQETEEGIDNAQTEI
jgi:translation initiation factor IF-3